ncbi:HpcH/HpaI aldolase/citrate lyase family protein [Vibrio fluminensis]|uniref:HpcH/HpaI aldolase/citrate lyase family protein n=1 Tax=Vibrio fluminensis TaxID=2783614 RepID=UPI001887712F|nr:HpcH/HpaI aldolase/citrate lyase family protein [Vibrio fluminensis]
MKHNSHNPDFEFCHEPVSFNKFTDKNLLSYCLGGTLYMPGTQNIINKILRKDIPELKSMVMCFEDAIDEGDLGKAEDNVLSHLDILANSLGNQELEIDDVPLIFVRVRSTEQFLSFSNRLTREQASVLTGFVFPKFYSVNAHVYLEKLKKINEKLDVLLYGMPILEGESIAYCESRIAELDKIKLLLDPYKKYILNVRVGGTDFSSLFGLRRGISSSIYNILPVRDAMSDILNFFNRMESGYTVSAPVWEYFLAYKQDDIKKYIGTSMGHSLHTKTTIVNDAIDGLLREVLQDKINGMVGKTVIHPSHLRFVNAMQAVTLEEYEDAMQILNASGGVLKSGLGNKMNEIGPHRNWASRVHLRAMAYGVIRDEAQYLELFLD